MYTIKSRSTGAIICNTVDPEEALLAEGFGKTVEAHGRADINKLAQLRCEQSPDYNRLPEEDERWIKYQSRSGRILICECIRMFAPDGQGYPQYLELVSKSRPDTSFPGSADRCTALDLSSLSPDLARAITSEDEDFDAEAPKVKLTKGLRKPE